MWRQMLYSRQNKNEKVQPSLRWYERSADERLHVDLELQVQHGILQFATRNILRLPSYEEWLSQGACKRYAVSVRKESVMKLDLDI